MLSYCKFYNGVLPNCVVCYYVVLWTVTLLDRQLRIGLLSGTAVEVLVPAYRLPISAQSPVVMNALRDGGSEKARM
jgi:hypothetical protein